MKDRLLLLQGLGGSKMAYRNYSNPITRTRVRRRRKSFLSGMGADVSVINKGITASFDAVKAVGMTALIAAGGAVATDFIMKELRSTLKITAGSDTENLAKAVIGIGGGIVIGKFLKKPQLGAAFAVGAVTMAVYNMITKNITSLQGMGYTQVETNRAFYPAPLALGAQRVERAGFKPIQAPTVGYGGY